MNNDVRNQLEVKFDISTYDIDIQRLYDETKDKYKDTVENILRSASLNLKDGEVLEVFGKDFERKPPNYIGLDAPYPNGLPIQEKIMNILKRIISGDVYILNFEGGVRGGKDIWAIYLWTKYLMVCPEGTHLVLGKSLEHALMTVLHSNGFGLLYTIPNGTFERTSDKGAQRGVFRFVDAIGRKKEILFYGNDKENDHEKFQGFTIGSTYVNEGMAQHINGLKQAQNRMASTKHHLMIITQNPKGEASRFYTEFERPLLYTLEEIELLEFIQDTYKDDFKKLEEKILKDCNKNAIQVRNNFYMKCQVPLGKSGYDFLSEEQKVKLQELIYDNNLMYDSMLRSYVVKDFQKDLPDDHKFAKLSMKKVVNYFRGGDNPNMIFNAIDYEYYHFTCEDNLAMDDVQKSEFKRTKGIKGTASYDRDVLGIRRTTDGAVYDMFTSKNIIGNEDLTDAEFFEQFEKENPNTFRVIALDGGFNHPTGIIDCEVDLYTGTVYQLGEMLLEMKNNDEKGVEYIYNSFLELVRKRKNRKLPDFTIIDPSATSTKRYFISKGIAVKNASNRVIASKGDEKTFSIQTEQKDIIGIDLVQTAMATLKYLVYYKCKHTIAQIGSYESYIDEKTGKTKVFKIKDDLVDPIRYVFNTLIKPTMWKGDTQNDGEQQIITTKPNKWDTLNKIQEFVNEEQNFDYPDRSNFFSKGFFDD